MRALIRRVLPAAAVTAVAGSCIAALAASGADEPVPPPTPRAECGPGSRPEPGMQGRVSADAPADGYTCNITLVGRHGISGGYKVLRFVDRAGRECAYYDTSLLFPLNVVDAEGSTAGVSVLDMSDPSQPVQTERLFSPAMLLPHESLELNQKRGLLAAVMGTPVAAPGQVDIYDVGEDCRHPVLQSSLPVGVIGHESGFAPDGRTFYATSIGTANVTAIDVSDPKLPRPLWLGSYNAHGLMLSDDGNRAYVAARQGLIILDVSEIQSRKPDPQVREVSRLAWGTLTIPQVAIPVTIEGRPYVVEVDEFSGEGTDNRVARNGPRVGAARIIDIADERAPKVVSNIRLEVHQPENRAVLADDPGATNPLAGYAGHYCNVPRRKDPGIVACSFNLSGLRVFDIRDPLAPREAAYFVAPPTVGPTRSDPSNWAMSRPAFVPARREVWYADGNSGFYALRLSKSAWPGSGGRASARRKGRVLTRRVASRRGSRPAPAR